MSKDIIFKCSCGESIETNSLIEWDVFESNHFEHWEHLVSRYPSEYTVDELW